MDRIEINRKAREAYHRRKSENPELVREQNRLRTARNRKNNPETHAAARRRHYGRNRDKVLLKNAAWAKAHAEERKEIVNAAARRRRASNPEIRLAGNLRARLGRAMRGETKAGSAVKDLGCTVAELKQHLEQQFLSGMTWDNYGPKGWHIDHRKPLASFDLTDRDQFLEACHFSNLQPLWVSDNCSKGAKVDL